LFWNTARPLTLFPASHLPPSRELLGGSVSYEVLNKEAAEVAPGCEGLLALDHFQVGCGCASRCGCGSWGVRQRACLPSWLQRAPIRRRCPTPRPRPPLQGNRTPHTDALSRGAITGLTLKHSRAHMYRALIESVCYGTGVILETMEGARASARPQRSTSALCSSCAAAAARPGG
jgi:hypothetical protein